MKLSELPTSIQNHYKNDTVTKVASRLSDSGETISVTKQSGKIKIRDTWHFTGGRGSRLWKISKSVFVQ